MVPPGSTNPRPVGCHSPQAVRRGYSARRKAGGLSLRCEAALLTDCRPGRPTLRAQCCTCALSPLPGGGLAPEFDDFTTFEPRVNPRRLEVSVSWRAVGMA